MGYLEPSVLRRAHALYWPRSILFATTCSRTPETLTITFHRNLRYKAVQ
jgi:hypothetical protein